MEHDRAAHVSGHDSSSLKAALTSPRVWFFGLLYFTIVVGFYGITFWLPQILKSLSGLSDIKIGLISAIPYVIAAIVMVVVATSSDRAGERRWHVAIPSFISAVGLMLSASTRDPILSLAALSLAAAGIWGALGPFWSLPTAFLSGAAAAGGIALINSLGNLGGFLSPMLIGEIRARTGSFALALFVLAAAPLLTGVLVLLGVRGGAFRKVKAPEPLHGSDCKTDSGRDVVCGVGRCVDRGVSSYVSRKLTFGFLRRRELFVLIGRHEIDARRDRPRPSVLSRPLPIRSCSCPSSPDCPRPCGRSTCRNGSTGPGRARDRPALPGASRRRSTSPPISPVRRASTIAHG